MEPNHNKTPTGRRWKEKKKKGYNRSGVLTKEEH